MKSYNVKSNAKRFARQLAASFPGYIADEPVAISDGAREWFPAVAAPSKVIATGIPEEISTTAMVNGKTAAVATARVEGLTEIRGGETGEAITITKPAAMLSAAPSKSTMTRDALQALANLPHTQSTPEEIEARRAERRARVATEGPKVSKASKADAIVELVSTANGATVRDLMAATNWQAHTIRGYIAGTLRKRGHNIVAKKIKGEETRYMIGVGK